VTICWSKRQAVDCSDWVRPVKPLTRYTVQYETGLKFNVNVTKKFNTAHNMHVEIYND